MVLDIAGACFNFFLDILVVILHTDWGKGGFHM